MNDYLQIKEEVLNNNQNNNNEGNNNINFIRKKKEKEKTILEKVKLNININKPNKNLYKHVKTNTTLLNETSGQNKYILLGFDKLENSFQFYSQNGFINFANKLDEFLLEEKMDIKDIIYIDNINNQILNILNKCLAEEKNEDILLSDKKEPNIEETKELNDKIKLRQIIGV